jgi:hypothetical protein
MKSEDSESRDERMMMVKLIVEKEKKTKKKTIRVKENPQ